MFRVSIINYGIYHIANSNMSKLFYQIKLLFALEYNKTKRVGNKNH